MLEILNFILISGIVINILMLFLLWKQKFQKKWTNSNRVIAAFFSLTLIVCIHFYAQSHNFVILYIITFIPSELIEWILGPLLLFYVRSIFLSKHLFKVNIKLHFAPSLLVLLGLTLPLFISIIKDEMIFSYLNLLVEHSSIYVIIRNSYLLFYLILTFILLLRLEKHITSYYSFNREKELFWIKHLLIGAFLAVIIDISTELYEVFIEPLNWDSGYVTVVFLIFLIIYLGFYGVNQSKILLPDFIWAEDFDKEKTLNLPNKNELNSELKRDLEELMVKEKPFLNETLTLRDLSIHLNTTDKKISSLLNQQMNIGFYDFINEYRVTHFVELVKTDNLKVHTLFSLAQESGFKSKATFNRFFKKHYNTTPTAYLNKTNNKSQ